MRFPFLRCAPALGALVAALSVLSPPRAHAQIGLGPFTFNASQFGDTLSASDGGTAAASNWVNVVNTDPGFPGYLTGANFDTGIANIGDAGGPVTYTIGYGTSIVNGAGDDFGLVVSFDTLTTSDVVLSVSTNGVVFTPPQTFTTGRVGTGVFRNYFYGGRSPSFRELFVLPLNLSAFGIAPGGNISAVQVTSTNGGDVIRVAGFGTTPAATIPEPGTLALLVGALTTGAGFLRHRLG